MNYLLVFVVIVTTLLNVFMIGVLLVTETSDSKKSFLMLLISVFYFQVGYAIEITSTQLPSMLLGVKIEYMSLAMVMIFLLWFLSSFCRIHVPVFFYAFLFLFACVSTTLVFTLEKNGVFYIQTGLAKENGYYILAMEPGPFWYVFFFVFGAVFLYGIISCIIRLNKAYGIEKKRTLLVLLATFIPVLLLFIEKFELTGGYHIEIFGIFIALVLYFFAIIRYSYFTSISAANSNIINHCREGIALIDNAGEIVFFNETMGQILPDIHIGKKAEQFHVLKRVLDEKQKEEELQGKKIEDFFVREVQLGEEIFEVRSEDVYEYGTFQGNILWLIDLTQHYNNLKKLKELKEFAEKENQEKTAFLARVSHEIRTPMNVILGLDEMILRENQSEVIDRYAGNIKSVSKTLMSLINDLLDISRINSGKMELNLMEYNLENLIREIDDVISFRAKNKGLLFHISVDPETPMNLLGDDIRIKQVLLNVLNNGVKYTEIGSLYMELTWEKINDEQILLRVTIKDTGIGIRQQDLEKIFYEFQRTDIFRNREIEGSGLGLTITRQLLNMMGGNISLSSVYGKGTRFEIDIPQKVVDWECIGKIQNNDTYKEKEQGASKKLFEAPGAKILIVDDNDLNLLVACELLKRTFIQIDTAKSGKECLEKVVNNKYDIILIDYLMPELSGYETLKQLNLMWKGNRFKESLNQRIPVIAFTAHFKNLNKELFRKQGFTDSIAKPVDPEELERCIMTYLPLELIHMEGSFENEKRENGAIPQIKGIDLDKGLKGIRNNTDKYLEILKVFHQFLKNNYEKLNDLFINENWEEYRILVHGIKASAYQVGAIPMGKSAEEQERSLLINDVANRTRNHSVLKQLILDMIIDLNDFTKLIKESGSNDTKATDNFIPNKSSSIQQELKAILLDEKAFEEGSILTKLKRLPMEMAETEIKQQIERWIVMAEDYEYGNILGEIEVFLNFSLNREKETQQ